MRIFNNKLTFDKLDKKELSQYDNVIFLTGRSEYAPEQKKEIIFIFD